MGDPAMKRPRLTIDMTPELRRRIKMAALACDVTVAKFVIDILNQTVPSLEELGTRKPGWYVTPHDIRQLNEIRRRIMNGRSFAEDSADLLREARAERTTEL